MSITALDPDLERPGVRLAGNRRLLPALVVASSLAVGACGAAGGDDASPATTGASPAAAQESTTTAPHEPEPGDIVWRSDTSCDDASADVVPDGVVVGCGTEYEIVSLPDQTRTPIDLSGVIPREAEDLEVYVSPIGPDSLADTLLISARYEMPASGLSPREDREEHHVADATTGALIRPVTATGSETLDTTGDLPFLIWREEPSRRFAFAADPRTGERVFPFEVDGYSTQLPTPIWTGDDWEMLYCARTEAAGAVARVTRSGEARWRIDLDGESCDWSSGNGIPVGVWETTGFMDERSTDFYPHREIGPDGNDLDCGIGSKVMINCYSIASPVDGTDVRLLWRTTGINPDGSVAWTIPGNATVEHAAWFSHRFGITLNTSDEVVGVDLATGEEAYVLPYPGAYDLSGQSENFVLIRELRANSGYQYAALWTGDASRKN